MRRVLTRAWLTATRIRSRPTLLDGNFELRFVGKRVEPRSSDEIDVVGDLTIKGITREIVLRVEQHGEAKDPWGNTRTAFTAKMSIDRRDFGLTWNQVLETGGVMVGDRVEIEAEIEAVKQVEAQVA
jgi:polyisoprenoid-binding protein YceI